jgi:hypothetical protein
LRRGPKYLSEAKRRSSGTGQTRTIAGFPGSAEYEGELAEFFPWLGVAWWTGVDKLQWIPPE